MNTELIEELRNTFDYHPDGYLIRKKNGKPCGKHANHPTGYIHVRVGKSMLRVHRIIYAIVYGKLPNGEIDHINGNRADNRIENLREVSSSENSHNFKKYKNNSSGYQGVSWYAQYQKWVAKITIDNRRIHLGYFENLEEAVEARKKAKIKHHPSSPEAVKYANESVDFN